MNARAAHGLPSRTMVEGERASIAMMFACSRSTIDSSANGRSEWWSSTARRLHVRQVHGVRRVEARAPTRSRICRRRARRVFLLRLVQKVVDVLRDLARLDLGDRRATAVGDVHGVHLAPLARATTPPPTSSCRSRRDEGHRRRSSEAARLEGGRCSPRKRSRSCRRANFSWNDSSSFRPSVTSIVHVSALVDGDEAAHRAERPTLGPCSRARRHDRLHADRAVARDRRSGSRPPRGGRGVRVVSGARSSGARAARSSARAAERGGEDGERGTTRRLSLLTQCGRQGGGASESTATARALNSLATATIEEAKARGTRLETSTRRSRCRLEATEGIS